MDLDAVESIKTARMSHIKLFCSSRGRVDLAVITTTKIVITENKLTKRFSLTDMAVLMTLVIIM